MIFFFFFYCRDAWSILATRPVAFIPYGVEREDLGTDMSKVKGKRLGQAGQKSARTL